MRELSELNTVFDNGDHITDAELFYMIVHYEKLVASLSLHGRERWMLVWIEATARLDTLYQYRNARAER